MLAGCAVWTVFTQLSGVVVGETIFHMCSSYEDVED
jgi:hypothetical protein